ncbi:hypothetical protein CANARDRAFT_26407 [[Candida] arabinofermentans NRRL YB-2248]|uniref:Plasma membrane proteolipid 3 n=1 Tax=[Candida] arabinofermentans NRRL YB-2248 TaxID=983967 RepID=A0A1E4T961_9ASCO|nr:hypothetical protein CANARDRAFT_26407 [[Candida] arabinofermentans NRRL YB-2248]
MSASKIIAFIIAVLLPPLAVFMERGAGRDLLVNIILCCFVYFPGILHACYIVATSN